MAPSPENDKEPKAPDKSVVSISSDDSKVHYSHTKDPQVNSEFKSATSTINADVENKDVETLDDGQLRALLDEAITYKCPKDREGKSSLFKELLEEVEQDEEACEAAARGGRGARRAGRGRREHHSSLQDLVAAMAAEPTPRPFLLSEEPTRGGYLATVRCVNPPPLAERRVSASDANGPPDIELVTRRNKAMFPMTYTARASLEIGSGSVGSGRAVTTTTASNQVRTTTLQTPTTHDSRPTTTETTTGGQAKLMKSFKQCKDSGGDACEVKESGPRGSNVHSDQSEATHLWKQNVEKWYESLDQCLNSVYFKKNELYKNDKGCTKRKKTNIFDNNVSTLLDALKDEEDGEDKYEKFKNTNAIPLGKSKSKDRVIDNSDSKGSDSNGSDIKLREMYRNRVGYSLVSPKESNIINPKNIRNMTIATTSVNDKNQTDQNLKHEKQSSSFDQSSIVENKEDIYNNKNTIIDENSLSLCAREVNCQHKPSKDCMIDINDIDRCTNGQPNVNFGTIESEDLMKSTTKHNTTPNLSAQQAPHTTDLEKSNTSLNDDNQLSGINSNSMTYKYTKMNECNTDTNDGVHTKVQMSPKIEIVKEEKEKSCIISSDDRIETIAANNVNKVNNDKKSNLSFATGSDCIEYMISEDCTSDNLAEIANETQSFSYLVLDESKILHHLRNHDEPDESSKLDQQTDDSFMYLSITEDILNKSHVSKTAMLKEIESNNNSDNIKNNNRIEKTTKKKNKEKKPKSKQTTDWTQKNILKYLLYSGGSNKSDRVLVASKSREVDSAIPFSCITTPEVVSTCSPATTTQSAVAVDAKPLQLECCYRAVASLTGAAWERSAPVPALASASRDTAVPSAPPSTPPSTDTHTQSRALVSSAGVGALIGRPTHEKSGAADEYKVPILTVHYRLQKSLDENGNAVHGFGSPISGSSQHKKPRRKKSSKNETVIKSHQIDGYQGNKDLNEVLRFIESNAEGARHTKPGRAKHKEEDDKGGKKRSSERRKDKESKVKRASSLEELSRTKLEDLTDKAPARRRPGASGDERRSADLGPPAEPAPAELTDFQTVTKRRKPRRRPDEPEGPRAPRPAARARSHDAPPRPPAAPPAARPPAPASYADIARSHNIPDLIESCNFYAEGDERKPGAGGPAPAEGPALRGRRERAEPDVVADGPPELAGVTFGFAVNEQLLRAPCDLLRSVPTTSPQLHQIIEYVAAGQYDPPFNCASIFPNNSNAYFLNCSVMNAQNYSLSTYQQYLRT
ncbi:unnamed protein product [Leptidea sinapis]|uniref:Uncharacterized protein n=1 Tax=Leptidea sinapis TaxID=189913 RepID=A0A5E4Q313_9NEOP|nr:unnamed protein product [Leptidea sinapis]